MVQSKNNRRFFSGAPHHQNPCAMAFICIISSSSRGVPGLWRPLRENRKERMLVVGHRSMQSEDEHGRKNPQAPANSLVPSVHLFDTLAKGCLLSRIAVEAAQLHTLSARLPKRAQDHKRKAQFQRTNNESLSGFYAPKPAFLSRATHRRTSIPYKLPPLVR